MAADDKEWQPDVSESVGRESVVSHQVEGDAAVLFFEVLVPDNRWVPYDGVIPLSSDAVATLGEEVSAYAAPAFFGRFPCLLFVELDTGD